MFLVLLNWLLGAPFEERWESVQACTSWHIGKDFAWTPDILKGRHVGLGGLALPLTVFILFPTLLPHSFPPSSNVITPCYHAKKLTVAETERISLICSFYEDLEVTRFIVGPAGAR